MLHKVNLDEVSDGKVYERRDMVRLGCGDCEGCSECCKTVGDSIVLDPYDYAMLAAELSMDAAGLNSKYASFGPVGAMVLPHLVIDEGKGCRLLSADGRCTVHKARPGMCRLFPLARIYEEDRVTYIHQIHECPKKPNKKVRVEEFIGIPNMAAYERYLLVWDSFRKAYEGIVTPDISNEDLEEQTKFILTLFYLTPFPVTKGADGVMDMEPFYSAFYRRMDTAYEGLGLVRVPDKEVEDWKHKPIRKTWLED